MELEIRQLPFWTNEQELEDLEIVSSKPCSTWTSLPFPKLLGNLHLGCRSELGSFVLRASSSIRIFSCSLKHVSFVCRGFLQYVHQRIYLFGPLLFAVSDFEIALDQFLFAYPPSTVFMDKVDPSASCGSSITDLLFSQLEQLNTSLRGGSCSFPKIWTLTGSNSASGPAKNSKILFLPMKFKRVYVSSTDFIFKSW